MVMVFWKLGPYASRSKPDMNNEMALERSLGRRRGLAVTPKLSSKKSTTLEKVNSGIRSEEDVKKSITETHSAKMTKYEEYFQDHYHLS